MKRPSGTCRTCIFFHPVSNDATNGASLIPGVGNCRRFPPVRVDNQPLAEWPVVRASWSCGERRVSVTPDIEPVEIAPEQFTAASLDDRQHAIWHTLRDHGPQTPWQLTRACGLKMKQFEREQAIHDLLAIGFVDVHIHNGPGGDGRTYLYANEPPNHAVSHKDLDRNKVDVSAYSEHVKMGAMGPSGGPWRADRSG
jgi:hypothetical protein